MLKQREGTNQYDLYLKEIKSVKSIVDKYVVPKYKFLWGIELSVTSKNSIITFIGSGFSLVVAFVVQSLSTEATSQFTDATGIDIADAAEE